MKFLIMVIMVLSIFTSTAFLISFSNNERVSAVCNQVDNKTTYCHEQYTTHTNTATTTITEEEEPNPFCMDLKCNLSDNDLLDSEMDTISSPLGDLDY